METLNRIAGQGANGAAMMPIIQGVGRAAIEIAALLRGAVFRVFLYPADSRNTSGKLRLLYEAIRMGFLLENAGAKAHTGDMPVLEAEPAALHQRAPVYLGSVAAAEGLTA